MLRYTLYIDIELIPYDSEDTDIIFKLIDEVFQITITGSLISNPREGLKFSDDPPGRTPEERETRDDFRALNEKEIAIYQQVGHINFCKAHNDLEVSRLLSGLVSSKQDLKLLPASIDIKETIASLEKIIARFLYWYRKYKLDDKVFQEGIAQQKKLWTRSKKEFAQMVRDEYKNNTDKYKDPTDALRQVYNQYEFKSAWTIEQCNSTFRKNH